MCVGTNCETDFRQVSATRGRSRTSRILKLALQVANMQDQLKIVLDPDWIQQTVEQTANTHVQQVANTVEVKTLKIIKMTTRGKKLDPDDDQSSKDQSGDPTSRDSSDSVFGDKIIEMPSAMKRQIPTIETVQKTVEVLQVHF